MPFSRPLNRLFSESRMVVMTMAICAGGDGAGGDMSYGGATSNSNDEVPSTQLTYFCLWDGPESGAVEA